MLNIKSYYLLILLAALLVYSCELDSDFVAGEGSPTITNLSIDSPTDLQCQLSCTVTFAASSTLQMPNNPTDVVTYTWDFGDNSATVNGSDVIHEYTEVGDFTITLTAQASGAQEQSVTATFKVSSKNTFFTRSFIADQGYDIFEVSDGIIVFTKASILKFDLQGTFMNSIAINDYADYSALEDENFVVADVTGAYQQFDKDLSLLNEGVSDASIIYALANRNQATVYVGFRDIVEISACFGLFNENNPSKFTDHVGYNAGGYSTTVNQPWVRHNMNYKFDDHLFLPLIKDDGSGYGLFSFKDQIQFLEWLVPTFDFNITAVADATAFKALALGRENDQTKLREVDKVNGSFINDVNICQFNLPGSMLTISDGILIATSVLSDTNCDPNLTIEGSSDIQLTKLDFQYNIIWDRVINLSGDESVFQLKESSDGGILMTGIQNGNVQFNMFLLKVDSEGNLN